MLIDAFFRFSAITLLLFVASMLVVNGFILRNFRGSKSSLFLFLASISVTALFAGFTPEYIKLPLAFKIFFRFMDIPHLIFIWFFALSLFQKEFSLKPIYLITGILYSSGIFYVRLQQFDFIHYLPIWLMPLIQGLSVVLMLHMIAVALTGRSDDLLEKRRKSRLYFVFIIAFIGIATALLETLSQSYALYLPLATIKVIAIYPAIVWLCFWLFSIEKSKFLFDKIEPRQSNDLNWRDQALLDKLNFQIDENQSYLEKGLTIASLAKKLAVGPHRLRVFINQTLGYENFSTYINTVRIKAIKNALQEPENKHKPILTIALQYGFNSLSPFNRAFKAIEGKTPSEYRQKLE
ncbi:MAG TPA: AraC family transcriptional regulator [Aeromonadales bacterium]|nr:AraC family transcriptional regulator [Aeromonadales bacterium]